MNPPTTAIHKGNPGGRMSPSSTPVITTLKSPIDDGLPENPAKDVFRDDAGRRSRSRLTRQALMPNSQTEYANKGNSA